MNLKVFLNKKTLVLITNLIIKTNKQSNSVCISFSDGPIKKHRAVAVASVVSFTPDGGATVHVLWCVFEQAVAPVVILDVVEGDGLETPPA